MADAPTFKRARRPEHKQQRREAILAAARALAERDGVRAVSLGQVAAEVGLAKSNVLGYFETREGIYLQLTAEAWADWDRAVHERLDGRTASPAEVADVLARTLSDRPLFCDLLGQAASNLEHNVRAQTVRELKVPVLATVDGLARVVAAAVPGLAERDALEVVVAATTLAGALWPMANPPPVLRALYEEDAALRGARVDLFARLQRLIETLIVGSLARSRA
jgi:AcrR family transcriptional regulator